MRKFTVENWLVPLFALLTFTGGLILFPFLPNHVFTLQLMFPLLAGAFLGREKGAASQMVFLFLALLLYSFFNTMAVGFPAPAAGASPTFTSISLKTGYLLGFIAAAYLVGKVNENTDLDRFLHLALTMIAGAVLVYLTALGEFVLVFRFPLNLFFFRWAMPFFVLDLLKAVGAAVIYRRIAAVYKTS